MTKKQSSVRLTIPANADYIEIVRLTLYGIANRMGFSFEDIEDLKVAVSESCNNAVLHAYSEMDDAKVDIEFGIKEDALSITIKDHGTSFNYNETVKRSVPLFDQELSDVKVGGLGLYLMQALVDEVEVQTEEGTEVILTKFLK